MNHWYNKKLYSYATKKPNNYQQYLFNIALIPIGYLVYKVISNNL